MSKPIRTLLEMPVLCPTCNTLIENWRALKTHAAKAHSVHLNFVRDFEKIKERTLSSVAESITACVTPTPPTAWELMDTTKTITPRIRPRIPTANDFNTPRHCGVCGAELWNVEDMQRHQTEHFNFTKGIVPGRRESRADIQQTLLSDTRRGSGSELLLDLTVKKMHDDKMKPAGVFDRRESHTSWSDLERSLRDAAGASSASTSAVKDASTSTSAGGSLVNRYIEESDESYRTKVYDPYDPFITWPILPPLPVVSDPREFQRTPSASPHLRPFFTEEPPQPKKRMAYTKNFSSTSDT